MFTGLVEEIGKVVFLKRVTDFAELTVEASKVLEGTNIGDSIAINGVCLTVTKMGRNNFVVQAVEETLKRTTLGTFASGTRVNLERAMRLGDRLGGHLVQGHIDGTGKIAYRRNAGEGVLFGISIDATLSPFIVEKGSIAVDGISLTVTCAHEKEFGISIIPHTLSSTTLGWLKPGDSVNLETDIIAKYVSRLTSQGTGLTLDKLKEYGF
jgi:riboflavin synthase